MPTTYLSHRRPWIFLPSMDGMQHIDNPKAKTNAPATVSSACIKVGKSVLRSIVRTARGAK